MELNLENVKSRIDSKSSYSSDLIYKIKKPLEFLLPSEPPLFQCILNKKQKFLKKEKPGHYHFYDDKCLYFDYSRKNLLKGVIFFHINARMEMLKHPCNKKSKFINGYCGFRIIKDQVEKDFYSNDPVLLEKIYKFLRKRIFQINFHQNYRALKQLGRGNFATVFYILLLNKRLNFKNILFLGL